MEVDICQIVIWVREIMSIRFECHGLDVERRQTVGSVGLFY